jgi:hypothetical protein
VEKRGIQMKDKNTRFKIRMILISLCILIVTMARPNIVVKAYDEDGFEIFEDSGILNKYYGDDTEVVVPEGITSIADFAFRSDLDIVSITLPDGITSIGKEAFLNCSSLERINIPASVTSIGVAAFLNTGIKSITIPEGVTKIEDYTFAKSKLTKISFPDSLTEIGYDAFTECDSLKSVKIPDSVTVIRGEAFYGCNNITSIKLSKNITEIDAYTFFLCSIEGIEIPEGVTTIGEGAFRGCDLKTLVLPDSVTVLEKMAFGGCTELESVTLSKNLVTIGDSAFYSAIFETIKIPEGVKTIGKEAFSLSNIKTIVFPESVTSVGSDAFSRCFSLKKITVKNPMCKIYENINNNLLYNGYKSEKMPEDVTIYGYNGSTANDLCTALKIPFVKLDKSKMDYPELKNKPVPKIKISKDSYTVARGKEIKIPYTITNADMYNVKVTGGTNTVGSIGYKKASVVKVTNDYVIIRGEEWKGDTDMYIRVGLTSKKIKIKVK